MQPSPPPASALPAWRRLHAALLPDYNRKATAFWCSVVLLGSALIGASLLQLAWRLTPGEGLQVMLGVGVAMVAGFFPLRIPGSKNSFAAGEIFIFTLLLLHGPAAATLGSAGEALVGSWRTSKRWSSRIASPAMAAVSMLSAASLFSGAQRLLGDAGGAPVLLLTTIAFSLVYFVLNTLLVTLVPKLKRNEPLRLGDLFGNFSWVAISYSGSAAVAVLVVLSSRHAGAGVLMAGVPIIALLLSTMHLFFRQQEGAEAVRRAQLAAMEREQAQAGRHMQELRDIAFQDSLTRLPNRRRMMELLDAALARSAADPQHAFALLFLDFDRFKLINDSLGHAAGDDFLVQVAERLQQQLRPQDVVGRLGGDEFAVLVEGPSCVEDAVGLAERLLRLLAQPVWVEGTQVGATASIGITSSNVGYQAPSEVLRDADIAMYRAKAAGKARYVLFDVGLRSEVGRRLLLEAELRGALAGQGLSIDYQPLFCLATGQVVGFEALARWRHETLGEVSPATFIPVAEDSGLIVDLTDFVLHAACRQLQRFQVLLPDAGALTMHVNLSANDVVQPGLLARITHAIAAAGLRPGNLTLELTENILLESLEGALPTLEALRALGVCLSVDDFGTGCSSLMHLSRLPLNSLKVDRTFVAALGSDSNKAIVRAIVSLAHALGKLVVAEGIETPEQLAQLRQLGCQQGQGFLLSRPLPPQELEAELRTGLCVAYSITPVCQAASHVTH